MVLYVLGFFLYMILYGVYVIEIMGYILVGHLILLLCTTIYVCISLILVMYILVLFLVV